jgi:ribonuclease VapC
VIVVDSSAVMAILLRENDMERCAATLASAEAVAMSAAGLTETMIVALRRGIDAEADALIAALAPEIVAVSVQHAKLAWHAYRQWGRGFHPARLNFGDCFAYALAMDRGCPLLYVGDDFAQTDIIAA